MTADPPPSPSLADVAPVAGRVPTPTPVPPAPGRPPTPGSPDLPGGLAYAGAVSRLVAYVVDLALMSALLAAASAVAAYVLAVVTGHRLQLDTDRELAGGGLALWWLVYFAGSWAVTGCTPGMTLMGLRVVRPDGGRAPALAALVRALTFPLSLALFGLGFLGIVFHAQRRALHDLLARTAVVYTPATAPPPTPPSRSPP